MSFLKVFLFAFLAAGVFGESELLEQKDVCQTGQNARIFRNCIERGGIWIEVDSISELTHDTFKDILCRALERVKLCVEEEGGFCKEQSQRGPHTIAFAQVLCEAAPFFDDFWNLISAFKEPYHFVLAVEKFTSCIKDELGEDAMEIEEREKLFDPPNKKYAKAAYACIVATALDVLEPENVKAAGRLFTAYYGVFGYDVADALIDVVEIN